MSDKTINSSFISNIEYFPSLEVFCFARQTDHWIIEVCENYQKQGNRNKCTIVGSQGVATLSIPLVHGKNNGLPAKEVKIAHNLNWQKQHWQTIKTNYGRSPFFIHYEHKFRHFYSLRHTYLLDYCIAGIELVSEIMNLKPDIVFTDSFAIHYPLEIFDLRSQNKKSKNFEIHFQPYPQVFEDRLGFIQNLSVLDLIFCAGPESKKILEKSKILYL